MSYYRTCPICGANLDPGEICDCMTQEVGEDKPEIKVEEKAS